jgi:hypothetical protein
MRRRHGREPRPAASTEEDTMTRRTYRKPKLTRLGLLRTLTRMSW